jgi:hypothetical protein
VKAPKRSSWNSKERGTLAEAVQISGSNLAFARQAIQLGNELGVRVPKSEHSAANTIPSIMQKRMTEGWMKDLFILAAEQIIERHHGKPSTGESPPPLPPEVQGPAPLTSEEAAIEHLRDQLVAEQERSDSYRQQALRHQNQERLLKEKVAELEKDLKQAMDEATQLSTVEREALDLLKLFVTSPNGVTPETLGAAALLVLRSEGGTDQS